MLETRFAEASGLHHSPILAVDSLLPQFTAKRRWSAPNHLEHDPEVWKPVFRKDHAPMNTSAEQEPSMRRILRKSIPFVFALLVGTLAGALVAGFALFAAHS